MPTTPLALLGFGFLLGLRHALEIDHLAAVSTIVSERRSVLASSLVGALWGLGHTVSLLAVALVVVALQAEIPPSVANALELCVAAMLVGLGVNLLWTLWTGGRVHHHVHVHGGRLHAHPHLHADEQADAATGHHVFASARKPLLVGLMHGLAGSAGLMLALAATIHDRLLALGYVATFGVGSIGGMVVMSVLLSVPLALAAERLGRAERWLRAGAAVVSVSVGVLLALEIGRA